MDQPQQQRGNFYAPINRYKQPGDDRPMFTGRITKPGTEAELPIALWAHEYVNPKSGEVLVSYSGAITGVATNMPPMDQIRALMAKPATEAAAEIGNLKIAAGQIVLFPNGFKAEAPEKNRPDCYGWVNPGDGTPPFKASVWMEAFEDGRLYLSGATQYPLHGRTEPEMQDATPDRDTANEPAMTARGRRGGKGRGE